MPFNDAYATVQDYRKAVTRTDETDVEVIKRDLTAISRYLDKELHQFFNYTSDEAGARTTQDRLYMPIHRANPRAPYSVYSYAESENPWLFLTADPTLDIDPLYTDDDLEITIDTARDGSFSTTVNLADISLTPRNAPLQSEPRPYYGIQLRTFRIGTPLWLPFAEVKVRGHFGWRTVPPAIEKATIELAAILRLESPRATSRINEMEQVVGTSKEGQTIIDRLKRVYYKANRSF